MADPILENETDDGTAEEAICRICSCEATEEEPLFYPCSCSGSMKYIHQDCLVAWLAHSKKQQCEFCGMPFRFSKQYSGLYELPARVLLRRVGTCGLHCIVNLLRICMAVLLWIIWVPHLTTTMWFILLWFGDGVWSSLELGPCYVSPPLSPDLGVFAPTISAKISAIKRRLEIAKFTASMTDARIREPNSFLSQVGFLKTLTPFSPINDLLIYILECQIVTFASVISFTLWLKLVQWVEHQQPRTAAETDDLREPNVIKASFTALKASLGLDSADEGVNYHRKMELIGMRLPVMKFYLKAQSCGGMAALFIITCVLLPYNIGRIGLILVENPLAIISTPIKITVGCLGLLVDVVLLLYEYATLGIYFLMAYLNTTRFSTLVTKGQLWDTRDVSLAAEERIISTCVNGIEQFVQFSPISYQALQQIKGWFFIASQLLSDNAQALSSGDAWKAVSQPKAWVGIAAAAHKLCDGATNILIAQIWPNSTDSDQKHVHKRLPPVYWEFIDRLWAILMGYIVLTLLGALLLKYHELVSRRAGQNSRTANSLRQLGASLRITSFMCLQKLMLPLYCGILIVHLFPGPDEMALMFRSPSTLDSYLSVFVQWLIGVYFMSRLSLFISFCEDFVCKDVLRKIRDLYNLSLHPAHDALNRSVINLLQRTALSTVAYSALIFICSSIVRRFSILLNSILHIRWSITESYSELLLNLILCGSVIPLSANFFSAHGGLHVTYKWWPQKFVRFMYSMQTTNQKMSSEGEVTNATTEPESDPKATLDGGCSQETRNLKTTLQVLGCILSIILSTGIGALCVAVVPLFTGRLLLRLTVSRDISINDTCALVLGLHIFSNVMDITLSYQSIVTHINEPFSRSNTPVQFLSLATGIISYIGRALYIYTGIFIYLPTLLAPIINIYLILPLRTFFPLSEPYFSYMLQSGMIGLLYIDLATTIVLRSNFNMSKIIQSSILDNPLPHAWAFTRAIVIPGTLSYVVLLSPFSGAYILPALQGTLDEASIQVMYQTSLQVMVYSLAITAGVWIISKLLRAFIRESWDGILLKGEMLHNFEQ